MAVTIQGSYQGEGRKFALVVSRFNEFIAGKLVEVNCVSPGGIPRINRLNNERLERKVIDFIEQRVNVTNHPSYRKLA